MVLGTVSVVGAIPANVPVVRVVPVLVSVVRITPGTRFVVHVSPAHLSCGCDTTALRFRGCHATALQFRGCHAIGTPNPWCTRHWHSIRGCHATSALNLWCARPGHFVTTDLAPPPPALHPAAAATIRLQFALVSAAAGTPSRATAIAVSRIDLTSHAQLSAVPGAYLRITSTAICVFLWQFRTKSSLQTAVTAVSRPTAPAVSRRSPCFAVLHFAA